MQPSRVGMPSPSTAKNHGLAQGTLLTDSDGPPSLVCSEMQEQLGGTSFPWRCYHPVVFPLLLVSR